MKLLYERLPDLVQPWARVSNRLVEELKAIGLAASAEVSERLTPRLVKAPTLLRYLRTIPPAPKSNVTVLGIDDFVLSLTLYISNSITDGQRPPLKSRAGH